MYRVGLIGCGKIGSEFADDPRVQGIYSHAEAYTVCPATTLVAICDNDSEKLKRCSERWRVTARYSDPRQMLAKQRPDIVSICTPDSTHADLIRLAIETPGVRAILTEKPLALGLKDAHNIVQSAAERGIVLAVNYSRRYMDSHIRLRDLLHSGTIGTIQTVGGYYTKGTRHNGTHWFDLLRYLVGEVTEVWGFDARQEGGDDPTLDAFLKLACGASAHLHGCDAASFSVFEMDVIGTCGRVRVIESGHTLEVYQVVDSPLCTGYRDLALQSRLEGGLGDLLLHAVEDLVRCLKDGGTPRCSGTDGIRALEIALAACESARLGCPVTLRQSLCVD
jgi:predicted dehydrogenase